MSNISADFGVLILGFNRPALLNQTLTALSKNADLSQRVGFFSLDGPRDSLDVESVKRSRQVFSDFEDNFGQVHKFYEDSNIGLRNKVIRGVTKAFNEVENLLVLEDDCLIGPSTFEYFQYGFDWLGKQKTGVVSGNYLGNDKSDGAFAANRFSSWGWGTNKETWNKFLAHSFSQTPLVDLKSEIKRLTRNDPLPYRYEYRQITNNLHKLNSWAIPFDMFLRDQLIKTLKPKTNQIQNIGFGLEATHTARGSSLSIPAEYLDVGSTALADEKSSSMIEKREAWIKLLKLARERFFAKG
jgi:hypothetical protein